MGLPGLGLGARRAAQAASALRGVRERPDGDVGWWGGSHSSSLKRRSWWPLLSLILSWFLTCTRVKQTVLYISPGIILHVVTMHMMHYNPREVHFDVRAASLYFLGKSLCVCH